MHKIIHPLFLLSILVLSGCLGGSGGTGDIANTPSDQAVSLDIRALHNGQPADGSASVTLHVVVRDRNNLPLSDVPVSFDTASTNAVLSTYLAYTGSDGQLNISVSSSVAEDLMVFASVGNSLTESVMVSFRNPNANFPPVSQLHLIAANNAQTVGNQDGVILIAVARDANGVPMSNVTINFTSTSSSAVLSVYSGQTGSDGSLSIRVTDSVAETFTVTARSGEVAADIAVHFNDGTIDPRVAAVELSVAESPQPADGVSSVSVIIVARDHNGVPLAGIPVSFRSTSRNAQFGSYLGTTGSDGKFTTTVTSTMVESFELTAIAGGVTGETHIITFTEVARVESPVHSVQTIVANNFQAADGVSPITLSISVRDSHNTPLSGIPVVLTSSSPTALLAAYQGETDASGRFITTVTSSQSETLRVTANADGVPAPAVELNFIAAVGAIELTTEAAVQPHNGIAEVTLRLLDKNGNGMSNVPFQTFVSGAARLIGMTGRTGVDGSGQFQVTDDVGENVTVTVTSGHLSKTLTFYFGVSLSLLPGNRNALDRATLTALLKDGYNQPLAGQEVSFSFVTPNTNTLAPNRAQTNSDGTASVTIENLGREDGQNTIQVRSGGATAQATVNFLPVLASGYTLALQPAVALISQGGTVNLSAQIKDSVGMPVSDQQIDFWVDGQARIGATQYVSAITDVNGEVQVTVTDDTAENIILTANVGSAQKTAMLYFGATLDLLSSQPKGIANGQDAVTFTATVLDGTRQGIPGVSVNFRVDAESRAQLNTFRGVTDALGRVQVGVTDSEEEQVTVIAYVDALRTSASLSFSHGAPVALEIETEPRNRVLTLNDTIPVIAHVQDSDGQSVGEGERVRFSTNNIGLLTQEFVLTDSNGEAHTTFAAGTVTGIAVVTATLEENSQSASVSIPITTANTEAGALEIVSIEPQVIGIKGSSSVQTARIRVRVKDPLGNLVGSNVSVTFSLGGTTDGSNRGALNGGESLANGVDSGSSVTTSTINGIAEVVLRSGFVAGSVGIIAYSGTAQTEAAVTIIGGLPDANHFELSAEYFNLFGAVTYGLQDKITAFVGDRFGNVVSDNTKVSFVSEGGFIGTSQTSGAFTTTTQFGQASAVLQTAPPTTPDLAGMYVNAPDTLGNVGINTILAYTPGSESFTDLNGNGLYDTGEPFSAVKNLSYTDSNADNQWNVGEAIVLDYGYEDSNGNGRRDPNEKPLRAGYVDENNNGVWDSNERITNEGDVSEPFIDANDNQRYEVGEFYVDVNNNGRFDGPDGIFQNNTMIWSTIKVLFSGHPKLPTISPPFAFNLCSNRSSTFTISSVMDEFGNALVSGTTLSVTASLGELLGDTQVTLGDRMLSENYSVTLNAPPPPRPDCGDNQKITETHNEATLSVQLTLPNRNLAPGGDGTQRNASLNGSFCTYTCYTPNTLNDCPSGFTQKVCNDTDRTLPTTDTNPCPAGSQVIYEYNDGSVCPVVTTN